MLDEEVGGLDQVITDAGGFPEEEETPDVVANDPSTLYYDDASGRIEHEDGEPVLTADGTEIYRNAEGALIDADGNAVELPPVVDSVVPALLRPEPELVEEKPEKVSVSRETVREPLPDEVSGEWAGIEAALREDLAEDGYDEAAIERKVGIRRREFMAVTRIAMAQSASDDAIEAAGIAADGLSREYRREITAAIRKIAPEHQATAEAGVAAAMMVAQKRIAAGTKPADAIAEMNALFNPAPAPSKSAQPAQKRPTPPVERATAGRLATNAGPAMRPKTAADRFEAELATFVGAAPDDIHKALLER